MQYNFNVFVLHPYHYTKEYDIYNVVKKFKYIQDMYDYYVDLSTKHDCYVFSICNFIEYDTLNCYTSILDKKLRTDKINKLMGK